MAHAAGLKPSFRVTRPTTSRWVVNVPRELSPTGKRQQLCFSSKAAATAECEKLKARKDNFGISLTALTAADISIAAECKKLLAPYGLNLLDATRFYVQKHKERTASLPFGEVFDLYIKEREEHSQYYRYAMQQTKAKFKPLLDRMICDITADDLRPTLKLMPDSSRDTRMRVLRSVFNLAIKREWRSEGNPIARLEFSSKKTKEVETIAVEHVAGMLNHALENDLVLLPFLILGFYCGIRPDGELLKIEWRDIDWSDGVVTVRPEVAKKGRRRFPQLSDNARVWLEAYHQRGGRIEGKIVPVSSNILRKKRRVNWKAAGVTQWVKQGMRHTFCSCWLAVNRDADELVLLSGHTDKKTMWDHYHKGVKKSEAEKFWSIMPPGALPNVVAFQKQA